MHGDFSLNPFAYRERVSRVLSQQGRVQLDSDANEGTEALLRFLRGLAFDTIGAHAGVGNGFELVTGATAADLTIRWGVYYVDGIRCLNYPPDFDILQVATGPAPAEGVTYKAQPHAVFAGQEDDWTKDPGPAPVGGPDRLLYLDVFERHVSAAEDDSLREVALLGPDTASRAVIVWQVRSMPFKPFADARALVQALPATWEDTWDVPYLALNLALRSRGRLRARAVVSDATEPCTVAPDARYRGTDNRLFRVEVHDAGDAPTFKWSPDNGAVAYPVREITGTTVHLDSLGRDDRTAIQVNDWVEVVDDRVQLMGKAHPLLQVIEVRPFDMTVILSAEPADNAGDKDRNPILRRWASDVVPFQESTGALDHWIELADGVEVQFAPLTAGAGAAYRTGDHWLIPTRTATGDVQWPKDGDTPRALSPHGIQHHYAPLARITAGAIAETYRRSFAPIG
jgi:hypothetical protein